MLRVELHRDSEGNPSRFAMPAVQTFLCRHADPLMMLHIALCAPPEAVRPVHKFRPVRLVHYSALVFLHDDLKAVLRLSEKRIFGVATGYFHARWAQGHKAAIAGSGQAEDWFRLGVATLMDSHRAFGFHLSYDDDGPPADALPEGSVIHRCPARLHWQLGLKDDFASTIAPLGKHTRANLRYALVQARKRDWQYVPQMSAEQFTEAVHTLRTTCTHPFSAENAADRIRYSMALPDFFAAGLRNAQGEWLSCIVAQRSPRSTDIVWQMNSPDKKISISTTIRSFLLKHESEAGSPCLRVIGGTSPHLQHQLLPLSGTTIFLFRKGFRYALVRLLQARLLHRTPHTPALPFLQHAGQAASSPACSPERTKSPDLFHSQGSIV